MAFPDLTDRKILYELDIDARQSNSQIAKKIGTSKEVVNYRVNRLIEKGIINYFHTIIDSGKLGFTLYRIFIKYHNLTKEKEQKIYNYLKSRVGWFVSVRGEWDMNIAVFKKRVSEFQEFWEDFINHFGNIIEKHQQSIIPSMWHYRKGYLLYDNKDTSVYDFYGKNEVTEHKLDNIDKKILQILVNNARMTTIDIAERIKTTEMVVRYRIKKLEESKIILNYRAFVNVSLLGYRYFKLHFQLAKADTETIKKIRSFMHHNPNIVHGNTAIGGWDLEMDVQFKTNEELYNLIDSFREKFPKHIKNYEFMEYIKEYKFEYLPKLS
jgi:DNA-binding Lrp family transcriptional regulator|tara:strand:+ start:1950 stop:2921 length:972 start_codon:yes stop_codon:yes gene_type:complete